MRETTAARRASVRKWFDRELARTIGEVFSPSNMRRAAGPLATLGTPTIKVRIPEL